MSEVNHSHNLIFLVAFVCLRLTTKEQKAVGLNLRAVGVAMERPQSFFLLNSINEDLFEA